jgi:hypothetical protein
MSLFKTKAIILEIKKQSKDNHLYFVFSSDYWKILVNKKVKPKEKNLDIWYNINCEIEVNQKQDIHKIKNIKIINQFNYTSKNYQLILAYLELIWLLNQNLKTWVINPIFYDIINKINNLKNINYSKIILAKLKILHQLWILKIQNNDEIINKILKFIEQNNIEKILLLQELDTKIIEKLEQIIKTSLISD